MPPQIASLTVFDLDNGYVRIVGSVTIDGATQDIDYDAPKFMLDALIVAARQQGALT